jgi:hypothetical protein
VDGDSPYLSGDRGRPRGAATSKPINAIVTVSPGDNDPDAGLRLVADDPEEPIVVRQAAGVRDAGPMQEPAGPTLYHHHQLHERGVLLEWEIASGKKPEVSLTDFVSIGAFTVAPLIIAVNPKSPWMTFEDFIKDAKANPGKFAYSSGGLYRIAHINTELLSKAVGLKFRHVPYGGGGQAVTAVVGGHEDFASMTPSSPCP